MINTQKRISSKKSKLELLVPNIRADRAEIRVDKGSTKLIINRTPFWVSVEFCCCQRLKFIVIKINFSDGSNLWFFSDSLVEKKIYFSFWSYQMVKISHYFSTKETNLDFLGVRKIAKL